jgi:hypothetical protein
MFGFQFLNIRWSKERHFSVLPFYIMEFPWNTTVLGIATLGNSTFSQEHPDMVNRNGSTRKMVRREGIVFMIISPLCQADWFGICRTDGYAILSQESRIRGYSIIAIFAVTLAATRYQRLECSAAARWLMLTNEVAKIPNALIIGYT